MWWDWRRQVSTTRRIVPTNWLSYPLCVPNDSFRQITAGCDARSHCSSAPTHSAPADVHSHDRWS